MARPLKEGLDYFPFNVDFFEDDKVQLISSEFGVKAELVIIRLFAKIYKNGYYCKWGEDQCLLFSKAMGVNIRSNWIREVVDGCVRRCLFDKGCYETSGVLTSTAIQRRYILAIKERKTVVLDRPHWLLSSDETPLPDDKKPDNPVNPPDNSINPPNNPQTKSNRKDIEKRTFVPPSLEAFKNYFSINGFPTDLAERVFKSYDVAEWRDTRGSQIKNWKQKCLQVWFKPENKITNRPSGNIPQKMIDENTEF